MPHYESWHNYGSGDKCVQEGWSHVQSMVRQEGKLRCACEAAYGTTMPNTPIGALGLYPESIDLAPTHTTKSGPARRLPEERRLSAMTPLRCSRISRTSPRWYTVASHLPR